MQSTGTKLNSGNNYSLLKSEFSVQNIYKNSVPLKTVYSNITIDGLLSFKL